MDWGVLWPWRGAALAFLVAACMAFGASRLRRPRLAALAAGAGVLGGWWATFGLLTATPRQLPERLPLLALALLVLAGLGGAAAARWRAAGPLLTAAGALGAGWWMAGAPLHGADLPRAMPVLAGVAGAAFVLAMRGGGRGIALTAVGSGFAGLLGAAAPGPGVVLGAGLLGAALGSAAVRPAPAGSLAALPLAGGLAALVAMPVVARGGAADWAAAAAPVAAVLLGPAVAPFLPRGAGEAVGAALVALPLVALSFFLR